MQMFDILTGQTVWTDELLLRPQPQERCEALLDIAEGFLHLTEAAGQEHYSRLGQSSSACGDVEDPSQLANRGFVVVRDFFDPQIRQAWLERSRDFANATFLPRSESVAGGGAQRWIGPGFHRRHLRIGKLSDSLDDIETLLGEWAKLGWGPRSWRGSAAEGPYVVGGDFITVQPIDRTDKKALRGYAAKGVVWPFDAGVASWHSLDGGVGWPNVGMDGHWDTARGVHHVWAILHKEAYPGGEALSNLDMVPTGQFEQWCKKVLSSAVDSAAGWLSQGIFSRGMATG